MPRRLPSPLCAATFADSATLHSHANNSTAFLIVIRPPQLERSRRWSIRSRARHDLFRGASQPQDVQAAARAVRAVDETPVVDFDVVRHASLLALAGRRFSAELPTLTRLGVAAGWNGVVVGGRHEVADFTHRERIADVPDANAGVEPGEDRDLSVVRRIERFRRGVCAEATAAPAIVTLCFLDAEGRQRPWRRFMRDIHEPGEMRCRSTLQQLARRIVLPAV